MISFSKIVSCAVAVAAAKIVSADQTTSCIIAVVVSQIVCGFLERSDNKNDDNCKSSRFMSKIGTLIAMIFKVMLMFLVLQITKIAFSILAICSPWLSKICLFIKFCSNKFEMFSTFAGEVVTDFVSTPSPAYEIQTCIRLFGVSKKF